MNSPNKIPADLQDNLRAAMAIELSTMPPYLYAYWSIKPIEDGGSRKGAQVARIIMSVVVEEMLHMGLVSNVLNSLGGTPAITSDPYLPNYPTALLRHIKGDFGYEVYLRPLSIKALDTFLDIEQPASPPKTRAIIKDWKTIGEFYRRLEGQIKQETKDSDYSGLRQLPEFDNPGAGTLIQVKNLSDAIDAFSLIVEQGEGFDDTQDDEDHELSHYYKFLQIKDNIQKGQFNVDKDVYPIVPDPFTASYNAEQLAANKAFNIAYSELLDALQATFSSDSPDVFYTSTGLMGQLGQLAAVLRNTGTIEGTNYLPGPTFEYIPTTER